MAKFDQRHGPLASLLEQVVRGDEDCPVFAIRREPPGFGKPPRDKDEARLAALAGQGYGSAPL